MKNTEYERIFLLKKLPKNLNKTRHVEVKVGDFHNSNRIDALKIKQSGKEFFLIKKQGKTCHKRIEHIIHITKGEFDVIYASAPEKHEKKRYFYKLKQKNKTYTVEIDVYKNKLAGYVRAEVEFKNSIEQKNFVPPDWFAEEITPINFEIHKDLPNLTFTQIKNRYKKKGIALNKLNERV